MTVRRLLAILFIFVSTAFAWVLLGASVNSRTSQSRTEGGQQVAALWGGRHTQMAPRIFDHRIERASELVTDTNDSGEEVTRRVETERRIPIPIELASSAIEVRLDVDHRKKGLLWYDTYTVDFRGDYTVSVPDLAGEEVQLDFQFPSASAIYDDFSLTVDGTEVSRIENLAQGISARFATRTGTVVPIEVRYRSRGFDTWGYRFGAESVGQVRNFSLGMTTNFDGIDFPPGALSPSRSEASGKGRRLEWRFENLLSGQHVGVDVPNKLDPGPLAARITFFAPVSLLFFITVLIMLGALGVLELHPMHYFFLSAAFFSFHLLLAYLADHVDIHLAFAAASAVSLALVLSYLRLVCGLGKALRYAGSAQLVFLVLFGYAFFFEGLTGLTVTLGSIVTLFVLMQLTARVDWGLVFEKSAPRYAEKDA